MAVIAFQDHKNEHIIVYGSNLCSKRGHMAHYGRSTSEVCTARASLTQDGVMNILAALHSAKYFSFKVIMSEINPTDLRSINTSLFPDEGD